MKKIVAIVIVLILIVLGIFFVTQINRAPKTLKIGVILPLTGSAAYIGENLKTGMELARDEINGGGGVKGKMIEMKIEDSMNDAKIGLASYRKLLTIRNLNIVVVAMSTVTKALIPVVEQDKIPLFATAVSAEGIAGQNPWIFRFFTKADIDAKVMAEYAYQHLKLKKVAIIHVQDDFGVSYAEVFEKTFESLGGEIVLVEYFEPSATDFRTELTKIKSLRIDGIYILSYANNMALIPKQMKELGINATILSVGTISQSFVVNQAPDAIEGSYYTTNAFNTFYPQTEEMQKFVSSFEKKYGKKPEYFEVFGYDAIYLMIEAIKNKGYSREGIQKGLLTIHGFKGAAGEISVTNDGEINFPVIVARVVNGKPSLPLETITPK